MVLYALGMLMGNTPLATAEMTTLQDLLPNILIPLAIPMMLYGCNFAKSEARLQIKLCISGFISGTPRHQRIGFLPTHARDNDRHLKRIF